MRSINFLDVITGAAILGGLAWLVSSQSAQASTGSTTGQGGLVKLTDQQKQMVQLIQDQAEAALLDPAFMIALAVTESSLNPAAVGDDGKSTGLFQLTTATVHYWNPAATIADLLHADANAGWSMQYMRKLMTDFPGHSYGDYAEAWTLGGRGRFTLGRRNPSKIAHMEKALSDLGLTLNLDEVPQ